MGVFNGAKARDFRRRILTDQGNIDICKLCSDTDCRRSIGRRARSSWLFVTAWMMKGSCVWNERLKRRWLTIRRRLHREISRSAFPNADIICLVLGCGLRLFPDQIYPIWPVRFQGCDAYYILMCAEAFRRERRLPIRLPPVYILENPSNGIRQGSSCYVRSSRSGGWSGTTGR